MLPLKLLDETDTLELPVTTTCPRAPNGALGDSGRGFGGAVSVGESDLVSEGYSYVDWAWASGPHATEATTAAVM